MNLQKVLIGFLYLVQQLQVISSSGHNISVAEDDNKNGSFDPTVGG